MRYMTLAERKRSYRWARNIMFLSVFLMFILTGVMITLDQAGVPDVGLIPALRIGWYVPYILLFFGAASWILTELREPGEILGTYIFSKLA